METLARVFGGGPAGVEAVAHTMNVATDTLFDEVEPYCSARADHPHAPGPPADGPRVRISGPDAQRRAGAGPAAAVLTIRKKRVAHQNHGLLSPPYFLEKQEIPDFTFGGGCTACRAGYDWRRQSFIFSRRSPIVWRMPV